MTASPVNHDHARPDVSAQRAALVVARAILTGADADAHAAADAGGSCPACVAMAGISFAFTAFSTLAGDEAFMSEPVRLQLLALVDAAERELRSAGN
jgi:hypothetical protein